MYGLPCGPRLFDLIRDRVDVHAATNKNDGGPSRMRQLEALRVRGRFLGATLIALAGTPRVEGRVVESQRDKTPPKLRYRSRCSTAISGTGRQTGVL